jgi:drug/metabolite transporter (DMT)-like permease
VASGEARRELIGTGAGLLAILSWSTLAALSAEASLFPPFQLAAMTFGLSGCVGALVVGPRLLRIGAFRQPLSTWLIGGGGLFAYHAMYFAALRLASPVETNLLNQLWPFVFALLSVAALNEPLRRLHYVALVLAFCGAALLLSQGETRFVLGEAVGYALGLACAVTWGANSVAMRARPEAPSGLVAGYCAISAVLAFVGHRLFETTAWPKTATDLLPVALLALGPAGGAFFAWDYGVKRGNVALLGALAFATPVLSTFCLVVLKRAEATWQLALSCLAITVAAALARIAGALRPEEQKCAARR